MSVEQVVMQRCGVAVEARRFTVDVEAARRFCVAPMDGRRLELEIEGMARHFPRWTLSVGKGREACRCRDCGHTLVFASGLSCGGCGKTQRAAEGMGLLWHGLLPPIGLDSLPETKRLLSGPGAARHDHVIGTHPRVGTYVLVALSVAYPGGFPNVPPEVYYRPGLLDRPGMPGEVVSHTFHMLSGGRMCLFSGDWTASLTAREVLQQRAYAHVVKLLNYSNGKTHAFAKVTR